MRGGNACYPPQPCRRAAVSTKIKDNRRMWMWCFLAVVRTCGALSLITASLRRSVFATSQSRVSRRSRCIGRDSLGRQWCRRM